VTLQEQLVTLILMIGNSFFIGIIFDGYRVLKNKLVLPKVAILFIDICFGIISALFTFYLLLWSNNGQLRAIILLFFASGIIIYYLTISRYIVRQWLKLYNLAYSIYIALKKIIDFVIIKPLIYLYKFLILILSSIGIMIYSLFELAKKIIILIARLTKIIYNKIQRKFPKKIKNREKEGLLVKLKKLFIK